MFVDLNGHVTRVAKFSLDCEVGEDRRRENCRAAFARNPPRYVELPRFGSHVREFGDIAIVAGGPSLAGQIEDVRRRKTVMACGSVHDYLIAAGIIPKYCVIRDPSADHARFYTKPHASVIYLVASICDPAVFDALKDHDIALWHSYGDLPVEDYRGEPMLAGGSSAALRAMGLAHTLGYREQHYYGLDSCLIDGIEHPYAHDEVRPGSMNVTFNGRPFAVTPQLLSQAEEFMRIYHDHQHEMGATVYGDGLIATMLGQATVKNYDLD